MQLVLRAHIPRSCPLRAARTLWGQRQEKVPGPSETDVGRWHLSALCGTMYISAVPYPSLNKQKHGEAKLESWAHHHAAAARCEMKVEVLPSVINRCWSLGLLGQPHRAPTPAG